MKSVVLKNIKDKNLHPKLVVSLLKILSSVDIYRHLITEKSKLNTVADASSA